MRGSVVVEFLPRDVVSIAEPETLVEAHLFEPGAPGSHGDDRLQGEVDGNDLDADVYRSGSIEPETALQ